MNLVNWNSLLPKKAIIPSFHRISPLGRFGRVVEMSVDICVCPRSHVIFFEASHWPSDHRISLRPLIGQPSFPTGGGGRLVVVVVVVVVVVQTVYLRG